MMKEHKRVIVTGGAGFIGSALVRMLVNNGITVLNIDKLTYAGNLSSLASIADKPNYTFEQIDICDRENVNRIFTEFQPDSIIHLAAESHVDRSIDSPEEFINTNIIGTYTLLEASRKYWNMLSEEDKLNFRFLLVSTDEVYGSLGKTGYFSEKSNYDPRSPYSSSKASADHLVSAWYHTYGLPTLKTNCSNNYGPYHYPEKLIPLIIINALAKQDLPIYGNGDNIRDWLYVEDHVNALWTVINNGIPGESYNIGGHNEKTNLEVVTSICKILDEIMPRNDGISYNTQIKFVSDRPGHDARYAIDPTKIISELGWKPTETFDTGLRKTIKWYLENNAWWEPLKQASKTRIGTKV